MSHDLEPYQGQASYLPREVGPVLDAMALRQACMGSALAYRGNPCTVASLGILEVGKVRDILQAGPVPHILGGVVMLVRQSDWEHHVALTAVRLGALEHSHDHAGSCAPLPVLQLKLRACKRHSLSQACPHEAAQHVAGSCLGTADARRRAAVEGHGLNGMQTGRILAHCLLPLLESALNNN